MNGSQEQWSEEAIRALQAWHAERVRAGRYDRNLLQYAASIATVIGIGAGSGGVFAVADSLARNGNGSGDLVPNWVFVAVASPVAVLSAILFVLLVAAFILREQAEARALRHQMELVKLKPERFAPSGE